MNRREFLQSLAYLAYANGCSVRHLESLSEDFYDMPCYGDCTLLHFTDSHAQLLPIYYREPATSINITPRKNRQQRLSAKTLLTHYGIGSDTAWAYALTHLNFIELAKIYGKMGGYAHLSTLVKRLRSRRDKQKTLLLDGGDSWQGSATSLWTRGQDMIQISNLLGVDVMTGHWEFTYGDRQVLNNLDQFSGDFVAQNISLTETAQFERDADEVLVFKPFVIRELGKVRIAVIGQAFPYTPIANPSRFTPDWRFGIEEENLRRIIDAIKRQKIADVIVLLSHNGLDVDLKLAARISGLDFILGGHTHDAIPSSIPVKNSNGITWVTNAGSHGKFLAVLDLSVKNGKLKDFKYRLIPIFSRKLQADTSMQQMINKIRAPFVDQLNQNLGTADTLLFRRDTFEGTFDSLILKALMEVNDSEIAFSPGFRWGETLLPGQTINYEQILNQTAITYPETYTRSVFGSEIKAVLEDVADNLFNKDPYYRQGGDMVRVGGLKFNCNPYAEIGHRISGLELTNGVKFSNAKKYKLTGWAGVKEPLEGKPIWDVVSEYLLMNQ